MVCIQSSVARVGAAISYHIPQWEKLGAIQIIPIPDHWRAVAPEVTKRVEKAVPKTAGLVQIIVLDKLPLANEIGATDDDERRVKRIAAIDGFEKKLPVYLAGVGLDWLSHVEKRISKWRHGEVDRSRITQWLRQFDEAGSSRWIGEGLLKAMEFWTEDRLISSVAFTPEVLAEYGQVCMHRQQSGKSADVLANLFVKQIKPLNPKFGGIEEFHQVLIAPSPSLNGSKILFLEDGLFSGTEMTKILSDLLGLESPAGRRPKTPPLADKALLTGREICLLFPVATSFGIARLKDFLKANELPNISVGCCENLEVLSEAGHEALAGGILLDPDIRNCPANPDAHFVRLPFENLNVWKKRELAEKAIDFCKEIGRQLFAQYLVSQGYPWPEEKIDRCALGMFGMGLAFAFTHSVPKATIPLFWAGGKVQFQGKTINWIPLFPNAA